jgi:hypothetical protein
MLLPRSNSFSRWSIELEQSLSCIEQDIDEREVGMNEEIERLYRVTSSEEELLAKSL